MASDLEASANNRFTRGRGLLKHGLLGPAPSVSDSEVQGWAQEFTFLTSGQTTLMLLSGDYTLRMTETGPRSLELWPSGEALG